LKAVGREWAESGTTNFQTGDVRLQAQRSYVIVPADEVITAISETPPDSFFPITVPAFSNSPESKRGAQHKKHRVQKRRRIAAEVVRKQRHYRVEA
jgi:hypothetical protein